VDRGFTAAFELVATPALFGFIGWFLDGRLGTGPILTIALTVFVAGYVLWKLLHQYNLEMDRLEDERVERGLAQVLRAED
jgi:F0F1-type ATP synthase assembly protein I